MVDIYLYFISTICPAYVKRILLLYCSLEAYNTIATMAKDSTPAKASEKAQELAADNGMFVSPLPFILRPYATAFRYSTFHSLPTTS